MKRLLVFGVICGLLTTTAAGAQVPADVWRAFAERVDVGTEVNVRLQDGQRFRAVLIAVQDDAVLLQPKTRVPVPVQPVPYASIASMERRREGGVGAGKAAAIGVATGAGAFFGLMFVVIALVAD